ncbi:unnamed protein product [Orchesella dallaii]|uniref:BTB domain-containing protein n=1 Tax=Orchesella dallaii TaxID=48710 RepID=A0ABP1R4G2_9HEXA
MNFEVDEGRSRLVNIRACSTRAILHTKSQLEQHGMGWRDIDWTELELLSGPGEGAVENILKITNHFPPWREVFDAQRKGLGKNWCNVEIHGEDGFVPCHHVFLENVSEMLDNLIKEHAPSPTNILSITLEGIKVDHIRVVLSILYTGAAQLLVDQENEVRKVMKMLAMRKVRFERLLKDSPTCPKKFRQVLLVRLKDMNDEDGGGSFEEEVEGAQAAGTSWTGALPSTSKRVGDGAETTPSASDVSDKRIEPMSKNREELEKKKKTERIQRPVIHQDDDEEEEEGMGELMDVDIDDEEEEEGNLKRKAGRKYEMDGEYKPPRGVQETPVSSPEEDEDEEVEEDEEEIEEEDEISNDEEITEEEEEEEEESVIKTRSRSKSKGRRGRDSTFEDGSGRYPRRMRRSVSTGGGRAAASSSPEKKTRRGQGRIAPSPQKLRSGSIRKSQDQDDDESDLEFVEAKVESPPPPSPPKRETRGRTKVLQSQAAELLSYAKVVRVAGKSSNRQEKSDLPSSEEEVLKVEEVEECGVCHKVFNNFAWLKRHLRTKCGKSFTEYYDLDTKFCNGCQSSFKLYGCEDYISHVIQCVTVNHKRTRSRESPGSKRGRREEEVGEEKKEEQKYEEEEDDDEEVEVAMDPRGYFDILSLKEAEVQVDKLTETTVSQIIDMVQRGQSVHLSRPPGFTYTFPQGHSIPKPVREMEGSPKKSEPKSKYWTKRRRYKAAAAKRESLKRIAGPPPEIPGPSSSSTLPVIEPPTKKVAVSVVPEPKIPAKVGKPVEMEKEREEVPPIPSTSTSSFQKAGDNTVVHVNTPKSFVQTRPASDPEDEMLPSPPPVRAPPYPPLPIRPVFDVRNNPKSEGQRLKESLKLRLGHFPKKQGGATQSLPVSTAQSEPPSTVEPLIPPGGSVSFFGSAKTGNNKVVGRKPGPKSKTQAQPAPPQPPLSATASTSTYQQEPPRAPPRSTPTPSTSTNPPVGGNKLPQTANNNGRASSSLSEANTAQLPPKSTTTPARVEGIAAHTEAFPPPTTIRSTIVPNPLCASRRPSIPRGNEVMIISGNEVSSSSSPSTAKGSTQLSQQTSSVPSYSSPISSSTILPSTTISISSASLSIPRNPLGQSSRGIDAISMRPMLPPRINMSQSPSQYSESGGGIMSKGNSNINFPGRTPKPTTIPVPASPSPSISLFAVSQSSSSSSSTGNSEAVTRLTIQKVVAPPPPPAQPQVPATAPPRAPSPAHHQSRGAPPSFPQPPAQSVRQYPPAPSSHNVSILNQNRVVGSSTSVAAVVRQQQLNSPLATTSQQPASPFTSSILNVTGAQPPVAQRLPPPPPTQPPPEPPQIFRPQNQQQLQQQQQPRPQFPIRIPTTPRPISQPTPQPNSLPLPFPTLSPAPLQLPPTSRHTFLGSQSLNGSYYYVYSRPDDATPHPNVSLTYPIFSPAAQAITNRLNPNNNPTNNSTSTTVPNAVTVRLPVTAQMNPLAGIRAQTTTMPRAPHTPSAQQEQIIQQQAASLTTPIMSIGQQQPPQSQVFQHQLQSLTPPPNNLGDEIPNKVTCQVCLLSFNNAEGLRSHVDEGLC